MAVKAPILNIPIRIRNRKNIMLTANSIAATYSGASWADTFRLLRASTDMVAVLLYNPPTMPDTKIPDSRNTYLFSR
jgi:hypothetical protein